MAIPWDYILFISIIIAFIIVVLFFNKKRNDVDLDYHLYDNDDKNDFFDFD